MAQIWLVPTTYFFRNEIKNISRKQIGGVAIISVLDVFGTLSALKAYSINVSIAATIISLPFSMLMAFLASVFAPQLLEKHTLRIYLTRFAGAAVMIVAAFYLTH